MTPLYIVCHNCLISSKGQNYCSSFRVWGLAYFALYLLPAKDAVECFQSCVFVCLSTGRGAPWPQPLWTRDLTVQAPSQLWPSCWWHLVPTVGTCSNLFSSGPPQYWHLVATETCMVGKRAVCILLEYFLVC